MIFTSSATIVTWHFTAKCRTLQCKSERNSSHIFILGFKVLVDNRLLRKKRKRDKGNVSASRIARSPIRRFAAEVVDIVCPMKRISTQEEMRKLRRES